MTLTQVGDTLDTMTTVRPPAPEWAPPPHFGAPVRSRGPLWIGIIGVLIALAALAVAITAVVKPSPVEPPAPVPPPASAATPSPVDAAAAKAKVCEAFLQVSDSVRIATSAPDGEEPVGAAANARAAVVGGALALTRSVSDATPKSTADAANNLADAYMGYALTIFAERPGDKAPVAAAATAMRQECSS